MKKVLILLVSTLLIIALFVVYEYRDFIFEPSQSVYYAKDFGFEDIKSHKDKNRNGIDDYHDLVLSARSYIATQPIYEDRYFAGGYPDDGTGVCTDVIAQAFIGAGYNLKELMDQDIQKNPQYYRFIKVAEPNIDYRRVLNIQDYLEHHAEVLTLNQDEIEKWQPGDIVLTDSHIMILSDKRNKDGLPFIIHHTRKYPKEENHIMRYKLIGHYRLK